MPHFDTVVIGGGPAGSTVASFLKKYDPDHRVLVLEREQFPREHVGESQLPPISTILDEIGAWDKIEAANFPIKIGATYRWGTTDDLWDYEFYPVRLFKNDPRPAKFQGQRKMTAFQVERAVYDKILLDHAEELGAQVRQQTKVTKFDLTGNRIDRLHIESDHPDFQEDKIVTADHYVDCSGSSGILRRALGIEIDAPRALRNVAFWQYWDNAEWAVTVGNGATRVQVMSIGYGWLWFIPISPTKSSLGLVCPAEYYKKSGLTPEEIYKDAIQRDPLIAKLIKNATPSSQVHATKDWSFLSKTMAGDNWFLAGESGGFADPILAAGLTMAHAAARDCAFTILELKKGTLNPQWLKDQYHETQATRINQHIRFAEFWYSANGRFTDLQEYTREIARDAGLELDAQNAFQWLGAGGFITEGFRTGLTGIPFGGIQDIVTAITHDRPKLQVTQYTDLYLDLQGATKDHFAIYNRGEVTRHERYTRDGKILPLFGMAHVLYNILNHGSGIDFVVGNAMVVVQQRGFANSQEEAIEYVTGYLESLVRDGWVTGKHIPGHPELTYEMPALKSTIHWNRDQTDPKKQKTTSI